MVTHKAKPAEVQHRDSTVRRGRAVSPRSACSFGHRHPQLSLQVTRTRAPRHGDSAVVTSICVSGRLLRTGKLCPEVLNGWLQVQKILYF